MEKIVAFSTSYRWLILAAALVASAVSLGVTVTHFRINTEVEKLIDPELPWRKREIAFDNAFPQRANLIVAVIDGETPEIAEKGAADLAAALSVRKDLFEDVYRPDGGPFFSKNGLLLMSAAELNETTDQLIRQQGLLGPLSSDPSLRGLARTLVLVAEGIERGEAKLDDLQVAFDRIGYAVGKVLMGEPARLSWQLLLSNGATSVTDLRKFILIKPILNFGELEAGARATKQIRDAAGALGFNKPSGPRLRLTGPVVVADEEFATIAEDAGLNYGISGVAIVLLLWLAVRSVRLTLAVLLTTSVGLVVTAAIGIILVREFNPISVAFAALFVGLGVDFGIQFAVRYGSERSKHGTLDSALRATARAIAWPLTLAAISLFAGFLAFVPTSFRGVSELGLIAGAGMIVAYLSALTLLPALIAILRPQASPTATDAAWLSWVDVWIARRRRSIIAVTGLVTLAGIPLLMALPFDSDPMHLRSEQTKAISTYVELRRNAQTNPNAIDVLVPTIESVPQQTRKLERLKSVASTTSIMTFVPTDQNAKLAAISDVAELFDPILSPQLKQAAPTDDEKVRALTDAANALRRVEDKDQNKRSAAQRLARFLEDLAAGPKAMRDKAGHDLLDDFGLLINRLRDLLHPEPITLDNLPERLKADWIAKDGQARIEVHPKGDAEDDLALHRFVRQVRLAAAHATGAPISASESGAAVLRAFKQAGLTAFVHIFFILCVALRKPRDVAMTLCPLVLAMLWTLMALHLVGLPLNFANIIALPLMLAVGVAFHIYYVIAWRAGVVDMLASSLTRAIFFSALTTGTAFGSLILSSHPGTASMGKLLALSLFFTLVAAFFVVPAFLGPPPKGSEA